MNFYETKHGRITPYLAKILETHPLDTWSILEISQGLAPVCASSTIFWRVESGSGRPLTYNPPSWFIPLWPVRGDVTIMLRADEPLQANITHRARILETQPFDTWRIREMSQERTPECAISTILCRTWSGRGRPFTYMPPSWFTPVPPETILSQPIVHVEHAIKVSIHYHQGMLCWMKPVLASLAHIQVNIVEPFWIFGVEYSN